MPAAAGATIKLIPRRRRAPALCGDQLGAKLEDSGKIRAQAFVAPSFFGTARTLDYAGIR
jgi:hypothetical protein